VRPLRFAFNWLAFVTMPVWGGTAILIVYFVVEHGKNGDALSGRKWFWKA
jgi:hypothetical protein